MTAKRSLFRQEAIAFHQRHRQWGEVVLLLPLSTKILAWSAVALVAVIFVFLFLAQYSRKETVAGYLTPATGTARIFAPRLGVIRAVHIEEGQQVEEGQPLLTIDTGQIAATGEDVNTTMLATLNQQREFLSRQIDAEQQRTESEQQRLTATIHGLGTELVHLKSQVALQTERIRLAETLVAPATQLSAKGIMSDIELKRRQEALLEQKQNLTALHQQIAARQSQLAETRYSLEQVPVVIAEKIQLLHNELASTEQRIAEVNGRRAYVIRAPTTGRVSALHATLGQTADPKFLQLAIMPPDAELHAVLFVPTRAIGFVRIGQPVRILYEAFPYQSFGTYAGRTIQVSQTVLTASDVAVPIQLKEPVYRVTAVLERPDIDAYGQKVPVQPGMMLKADIILEKRSLMNWLLDPLLSART
ncbi:HlyD family secretion protein [Microvirga massiliensis]|uniref:HlyD family secretion protein n=1 Tax=Microvirga massiliensis TaxID=1033741 RepID=UPI00062B4B39|nr:HlyD family efflux transporter periplasmic adaptor subunit [Microvirga massiliensis]